MDPAKSLRAVSEAFDLLFANNLAGAVELFSADRCRDSPFHLMGLGVCTLLKAAFGTMEPEFIEEATRCLELSQAGAKKYMESAKSCKPSHRFTPGLEWEVLHTDAVLFLGLTHALSESYRGYIRCVYELNSAHSKFTRLFKILYPNGLDQNLIPGQAATLFHKRSSPNIRASAAHPVLRTRPSGFLSWWGFASSTQTIPIIDADNMSSSTTEELILSGVAFGYGLFSLVFSLLPTKVRTIAGFLGYNHDRQLALRALAVSASRSDVHSVFSGMVLMTYYGAMLHMSGYQADEEDILSKYKGIVSKVLAKYPMGTIWIANKAKIQHMTRDGKGAIETLKQALAPDRPKTFPQADALLAFELAWLLLGCRRYEESAEVFLGLMKMNSWSHATYLFAVAGCYVSSGRLDEAQNLLDKIPQHIERRRWMMATQVFIQKKLEFYKRKQVRRGGNPDRYVEAIRISPVEEFSIFWNTYSHIDEATALAHIESFGALTPPVEIQSKYMRARPTPPADMKLDLDTPDELAVRSLILGIVHRTLGDYVGSRTLLNEALKYRAIVEINTWVIAIAYFELAVLDMKEGDQKAAELDKASSQKQRVMAMWGNTFKAAREMLAEATTMCTRGVDLSARLDSRILMLREEIEKKKKMVGYE